MTFFIIKIIISGLIVALVSYLGQKFPVWGGILAALPIISVLSLSFLYFETNGNLQQVGALSFNIGWFVLSSGMFLLMLPVLIKRGFSFASALGICFMMLIIIDTILVYALKRIN